MALDAGVIKLIASELDERLLSCKIDKISQPTRDETVFVMRTRSGTVKLLISARSGSARVGLTDASFENPLTPPSFCMLMRKHLIGGRVEKISAVDGERIMFLEFACTNEMGDRVKVTVAVELMGRYSNLVLINNEGKIIDALKRVDFEASDVRQLLPGLTYTLPPEQEKSNFFTTHADTLVDAAIEGGGDVVSALMRKAGGVGPVICREAVYRAGCEKTVGIETLTSVEIKSLCKAVKDIQEEYLAGGTPTTVYTTDGRPTEFAFTALTQYLPDCKLITFDNYSKLLDDYYTVKDASERMREKSRNLHRSVQNLKERAKRKHTARLDEQRVSKDSDSLRVAGELLQANLHLVEKGATEVEVNNYYTGEKLKIVLNPRLSASANSQKYFKEYKKRQTASKMLVNFLQDDEREMAYLETVSYETQNAKNEQELEEIREELKTQGYLRSYKLKNKRQKPAGFIKYKSSDGFLILVGRNNLQNDKLTMHTARGKDLWFHTKNVPGSHTVVMSEGQEIPDATKNEAAMLAVCHSGAAASAKVAVDYTEVKNIRKTSDLAPGMVLYEHYQTAYITPDMEMIDKMEKES